MNPVERSHHNFTYKGNGAEIGDLSCFKGEGSASSHWKPTMEELAVLEAGGDVELRIFTEPIPPVDVGVAAPEEGAGEAAEGYSLVEIDGVPHRVPIQIEQEMARLVEGMVGAIESFRPEPGTTIVITTPGGISRDFTEMVTAMASKQFPDFRVAVMPEGLKLHTQAGLGQALHEGNTLVSAIEAGDEEGIKAAVGRWNAMIGADDGGG